MSRSLSKSTDLPIQKKLRSLGSSKIAEHSQRFFKTKKGEYGYGDVFLGIRVPMIRKVAREYRDLSFVQNRKLIQSRYHEERLAGLIILVYQYQRAHSELEKEKIYKEYVRHFKYINNWDLVDVTCPHIIGPYLLNRKRDILYRWVQSKDLWTRRIAIITNLWLIRKGDLREVFRLSEFLLGDSHDLIHKATGWVLREAGKKDQKRLETFLKKHYSRMPRTALRYATEKFPESKRKRILKGLF